MVLLMLHHWCELELYEILIFQENWQWDSLWSSSCVSVSGSLMFTTLWRAARGTAPRLPWPHHSPLKSSATEIWPWKRRIWRTPSSSRDPWTQSIRLDTRDHVPRFRRCSAVPAAADWSLRCLWGVHAAVVPWKMKLFCQKECKAVMSTSARWTLVCIISSS